MSGNTPQMRPFRPEIADRGSILNPVRDRVNNTLRWQCQAALCLAVQWREGQHPRHSHWQRTAIASATQTLVTHCSRGTFMAASYTIGE